MRLVAAPMASHHLDQVMDLENACFPHPWPRRVFQALMANPRAITLVGRRLPQPTVAAVLCLMLETEIGQEEPTLAMIQNLVVHPEYRRRGVAAHMLLTGLQEAYRRGGRRALLEVRPSNQAARRLYYSLGFEQTGRKPGYYAIPPEDAIVLGCRLENLFGPPRENG